MLKFKYRNKEYEAQNISDIPNVLNKVLPENTFKSILKTIPKDDLKSIDIDKEMIPNSLKDFILKDILKNDIVSSNNTTGLSVENSVEVQNQNTDNISNNSIQTQIQETSEEELKKRFEFIKEIKKDKQNDNKQNDSIMENSDLEMLNLMNSIQEQKKQKIQTALNSLHGLTSIQKNSRDVYLKDIVEAQLIKENVDPYTRDRVLSKMTNNISVEELKQILSNENISLSEMNDLQKYVFKTILSVLGEDFEFNDLISMPESSQKYENYQGEKGSPNLLYDSNFVKNLDEQLKFENNLNVSQKSMDVPIQNNKIQNISNTKQETPNQKSIEILLKEELWEEINNITLTDSILDTILDFFSLNLDAFDRFISFVEERGLYNHKNNISYIIDVINQ